MISSGALGTLYVSQAWGSDTFSGFCPERREDYQGPLKTIEAALERIRTLRAAGQRQPVSIVITDRIYFLDKPAEIDSSLELITIRGLSETVVSGGFRVTGFVWDTFNGHRCLRARIPQVQEGLWFTDFYVDGQRADLTALPRDGYFSAR